MVERRSNGALLLMVEQNHDQAEKGHGRLRADLRDVEKQLGILEAAQAALVLRVSTLERTPVNVEKVSWSTRQLIVIFGAGLSIAAGMWQLRVGIDAVQTAVTNTAKLQDERNDAIKEELKQQKAALEMRRVEIQNLSNLVQQKLSSR